MSLTLERIEEHQQTVTLLKSCADQIEQASQLIVLALREGKKVLVCGNGGSAADSQHIAAELTGRFETTRRGLPAIALTTDSSAMTAISNDFGYDHIFSRQIEALAQEGDVLIGISTSGNSPNVLKAIEKAQELHCKVIGLSGREGGQMNTDCDINIVVPSNRTARIQECHILIGHIFCEHVDLNYKD